MICFVMDGSNWKLLESQADVEKMKCSARSLFNTNIKDWLFSICLDLLHMQQEQQKGRRLEGPTVQVGTGGVR